MSQYDYERIVNDFAKDKKDWHQVKERVGQILSADYNMIQRGQAGLGTIGRNGEIDLAHAYDLARRTHPQIGEEIKTARRRKAEQKAAEAEAKAAEERRREKMAQRNETAAQTIQRSLAEIRARG
jgi:hypothetical protein